MKVFSQSCKSQRFSQHYRKYQQKADMSFTADIIRTNFQGFKRRVMQW